jgi:hypothetical protein
MKDAQRFRKPGLFLSKPRFAKKKRKHEKQLRFITKISPQERLQAPKSRNWFLGMVIFV